MCKLRKKFKTYALCFTECVKITRKDKKRMNTLTMAKRKKEVTPNQKLAQAIQDHIGAGKRTSHCPKAPIVLSC